MSLFIESKKLTAWFVYTFVAYADFGVIGICPKKAYAKHAKVQRFKCWCTVFAKSHCTNKQNQNNSTWFTSILKSILFTFSA